MCIHVLLCRTLLGDIPKPNSETSAILESSTLADKIEESNSEIEANIAVVSNLKNWKLPLVS